MVKFYKLTKSKYPDLLRTFNYVSMVLIIAFSVSFNSKAQTTLVAGDIAFTGINSNNNTTLANEFSFVILRTGGISAGTTINFTDNGWNTKLSPASLGTTEGIITWTATSALPQFTEVYIKVNTAGSAIVTISTGSAIIGVTNFILSQAGDQVFAYQGTTASPTFIAGIHYNANTGSSSNSPTTETGWDDLLTGSAPYNFNSSASGLPPQLTSGVNAVLVATGATPPYSEFDNGKYNCTGSTGSTVAAIRSAINNRLNWLAQNDIAYTLPSGCNFALGSPATITTQPSSVTVCSGSNTTFTVLASNATSYQWQVDQGSGFTNLSNGAPYSGVTTATLTVASATASLNGYQYRVIVAGSAGSPVTSNAVSLNVNTAPNLSNQPSGVIVCAGSNTGFNVSATGNGLTYQWQVNNGSGFTNISNNTIYSGATSPSLTITGSTINLNSNQYRVIVSGTCPPAVTSNPATLTVNAAPSISAQPVNASICPGSNTQFTVSANGSTSFQWQVDQGSGFTNVSNNATYSGATTASLSINGATTALNGFQYRVIVSGNCTPAATSQSALLTVADNTNPVISNCPSNVTVSAPSNSCVTQVLWNAPTATDNCSLASLTSTHNPGVQFPVGTTQVTYTATDNAGNTSTCSFNVIVNDITDPTFISCHNDTTVLAGAYVYALPTATDNCSNVTITRKAGPASGTILTPGTYLITYEAVDLSGNNTTCSFVVTATIGTGIQTMSDDNLKVYPNPTDNVLNVEALRFAGNSTSIRIFNAQGILVKEYQEEFFSGKASIDVTDLSKGLYSIQLLQNGKSIIRSLIKN